MASEAALLAAPVASGASRLDEFLRCFRGDFDNRAQIESERAAGLVPREGGGHEHIHCRLQPVDLRLPAELGSSTSHVLASYYFDGQPERIFRSRVYELRAVDDADFGECIQMRIYRLSEQAEQQLVATRHSACDFVWSALDVSPALRIRDCDVFWRWCGERFEGRMRTESIIVDSPILGKPIVVRDDVSLSENALWCNDRGNGMDGSYIYGNIHGVPYKMDRVPWSSCESVPMDTVDDV